MTDRDRFQQVKGELPKLLHCYHKVNNRLPTGTVRTHTLLQTTSYSGLFNPEGLMVHHTTTSQGLLIYTVGQITLDGRLDVN